VDDAEPEPEEDAVAVVPSGQVADAVAVAVAVAAKVWTGGGGGGVGAGGAGPQCNETHDFTWILIFSRSFRFRLPWTLPQVVARAKPETVVVSVPLTFCPEGQVIETGLLTLRLNRMTVPLLKGFQGMNRDRRLEARVAAPDHQLDGLL
jgi:hypothetical protein